MTKNYSVAVEMVISAEDEKDALKKAKDIMRDHQELECLKSHKILVVMDKGE